jgi:serine/threonine-protein kinase
MSPEQARGDRAIDQRGDVYALGAILYELLSGKRPHPGDSHNAILHHISTQPAVPLASVQAGLPDQLVLAVERALAADPNARPASAEAFGQSITPFAQREIWPAARSSGSGRVHGEVSSTLLAPAARPASADASAAAATTDRAPMRDRAPKRPRAAVWVAAAAGAATLAIIVGVVRHGQAPRAPAPRPSPVTMPTPAMLGPKGAPFTPPTTPAPDKTPVLANERGGVRGRSSGDHATLRTHKPRSPMPAAQMDQNTGAQPAPAGVHFDQDNPYQ